jgi:NAD(P)-dependent dehydrogenase (short-subunit alcohol dehydrogenase family)
MAAFAKLLPGVAVITGAGGTGILLNPVCFTGESVLIVPGIGAAVAKSFARAGCTRIAITDINPKTLEQTRDAILRINPSAQVFNQAGDIANEKFVDSFNDETFSKFSRLDYAVNCAGILGGDVIKAVEMTTEAFDLLNNINYKGSWLCCRAQLRNMLKQQPLEQHPKQRGSIVNIASQLGVVARPGAGESVLRSS